MVRYLTGVELRRQWRSAALLAVLVALVVGTVLGATAGARRSRTAFDRYLAEVNPPHLLATGDLADLDQIVDLPFVTAAPAFDLAAVFPAANSEEFFPMAVSVDGLIPQTYLRSPVVAGRLADPRAPLEVNLGERTAQRLGAEVGDAIPMLSLGPDSVAALDGESDPSPDGPAFDLQVVGIVRDAGDIGARATDLSLTFLTPAFRERYPFDEIGSLGAGRFAVLDRPQDVTALSAALDGAAVELDPSFSADVAAKQADPTMAALATALYVFAAVVGVAGIAAIGFVVGRVQHAASGDDRILGALGVGRAGRWARLVAPGWVAVVAGTVLGLVLSVAASPLHPIGLARRADPDLGVDIDWTVLLLGGSGALVVGLGLVAGVGGLRARAARTEGAARSSGLSATAAAAGAPPSVVTGLTMAFGSRGRRATAGTGIGGTALGVLGIVAAIVFAASIDRLVATPSLYGWGWDALVAGSDLSDLSDDVTPGEVLVDDPDLSVVAQIEMQLEATLDGTPVFLTAAIDLKGHLEPVVVRGAAPSRPDEIALGRDTLDDLGASIGDRVTVDLGGDPRAMQVSGVVALPVSSDGGSSTEGGYLGHDAATALATSARCEDGSSCYRNLAITLAEGADLAEVVARYEDPERGVAVDLPTPPGEVERLTAVERLPWFLALFLGLLAAVAVTYSAAVAVRRRRRDLALLRVVGMTAAELRAVVTVQVLALSVSGALLGTVLGTMTGRQVWRWVAESVSIPFAPALPGPAVALVVLAALAVTEVAATSSRRAAGRIAPAIALRSE